MAKTKQDLGFLGVSLPRTLIAAMRERAYLTGVPVSREIRPILEAEYLPKKKLSDKQKTGKLRK